jgi:hypothetical protein
MKWLFRPSSLVLLAAALSLTAGVFVFWRFGQGADSNRALPRPVPRGDQEIVWLNPATNAVSWERFVAAVHRLTLDRPDLGLEVAADSRAFPSQTADVPELAVSVRGKTGRLWFRWYKLTGDLGPGQWIEAFAQRKPPPLAIIGGGSSDWARDLAQQLQQRHSLFASSPLLLITTATANLVGIDLELMKIYAQRTFRFCFTNRQMARAVADFIWHQDDLRPDSEPIYLARWEDDPYSEDLFDQFHDLLGPDGLDGFGQLLQRTRQAKVAARNWGWLAGLSMVGGIPVGLDLEGFRQTDVAELGPFVSLRILYSIGSFNRPNRWEEEAAEKLLRELDRHPGQQRPLLVVPAIPQPARRFLRAVLRTSPVEGRRFVVATGDAIDFNTIYRDRNLNWPIQDLPVALVFFCHRNPVDPVAFRQNQPGQETTPPDPGGATSTGTQDLLLFRDIVETVVESAYRGEGLLHNADELGEQLRAARLKDGRSRFTPNGNQQRGTGEYIVCLRPQQVGERVLPQARLQVWNRSEDPEKRQSWVLISELLMEYASETGD